MTQQSQTFILGSAHFELIFCLLAARVYWVQASSDRRIKTSSKLSELISSLVWLPVFDPRHKDHVTWRLFEIHYNHLKLSVNLRMLGLQSSIYVAVLACTAISGPGFTGLANCKWTPKTGISIVWALQLMAFPLLLQRHFQLSKLVFPVRTSAKEISISTASSLQSNNQFNFQLLFLLQRHFQLSKLVFPHRCCRAAAVAARQLDPLSSVRSGITFS